MTSVVEKNGKKVTSGDIFIAVRTNTKTLNLHERVIYPNMIGENSLLAGGVMVLNKMVYKDSIIRKFSRCISGTWKIYIHSQISKLSEGIAQKKSTPIPYQNFSLVDPPQNIDGLL